jgi:hypothetical protein
MAAKKKPGADFRLVITRKTSERLQLPVTVLRLETVQSFASFRYQLSVEERLEGNTMHFKVLGLSTPQLSLPASGPAQYTREFPDLKGRYQIIVEGLDGSSSAATITVGEDRVRLTHPPSTPHLIVLLEESHNTPERH